MNIKKIINQIWNGRWEARKLLTPYRGYGVYHTYKHTILDTGLTMEEAQDMCDKLNEEES